MASSNETSTKTKALSIAGAILFAAVAMYAGYRNIGLPPVIIVGGSSLIGMIFWVRTYLERPLDPRVILPPFLLTVAALEAHMAEEYLTSFGPAMSRVFGISWSEPSFLMVFAFIGPVIYSLTALGLFYRVPLAGFIAWFIFIGPGVAEFTHFIFPLMQPAILPQSAEAVSQVINGKLIANMPNYWLQTSGDYYFSGMYTAVLPMIPGIWPIARITRAVRAIRTAVAGQGGAAVAGASQPFARRAAAL